jgi:predicted HD superfamily hydrolase involved in NAD metabolism
VAALDIPRYKALLRERLPEKRLLHTLSVAQQALLIGQVAGLDPAELETAGLLHDICRTLDNTAMLQRAMEYEIPLNDFTIDHPMLLHGPVAAEYCRRALGVENDAIYQAIYWHTTGCPHLGRLGQALYMADFSEPLRSYPEAAAMREVFAHDGFDAALLYTARKKVEFAQKKAKFHPASQAFLAWIESGMPAAPED